MMKLYIKLALLFICIATIGTIHAQENNYTEPKRKYTIAVQPFVLANGGLRLEFEKRLNDSKNWLQFHATGYNLNYKHSDDDYWTTMGTDFDKINSMKGVNLGAAYKSFFHKEIWYFSAGLSYSHYRVNYPDFGYHQFKEDGLTFYEYGQLDKIKSFNKVTPGFNLGVQSLLENTFFVDAYIGLEYRMSMYKGEKIFYKSQYGYGYTGLAFTAGFRVGLAFGK